MCVCVCVCVCEREKERERETERGRENVCWSAAVIDGHRQILVLLTRPYKDANKRKPDTAKQTQSAYPDAGMVIES